MYEFGDRVRLYHEDCLTALRAMPDASVHAVVTDPPYGLEFMGQEWDSFVQGGGTGWKAGQMADTQSLPDGNSYKQKGFGQLPVFRGLTSQQLKTFQQFCTEWATECMRVLKDGGYLLSFGGSRTYHRMACAIEDAGFEIRDQIMWVYGSGFPKSHNLKGDWEGWGTALKPAHEPIVMARKSFKGTVAENVLRNATGAINIDGCRIAGQDKFGGGAKATSGFVDGYAGDGWQAGSELGRWPANFIHDGSDEVLELFSESSGGAALKQSHTPAGEHYEGGWGTISRENRIEYGSGSAARFFYCAKPNKREKNAAGENIHPTVKPLALMRYLIRLVTPPNGVVLDPFAGSGTTLAAAVLEGMQAVGCEQNADYIPIIEGRVNWALQEAERAGLQPSLWGDDA